MYSLLREYRLRAGLSQRQVGKAMGLDQSRMSKLESGRQRITLAELRLFCEAVGITMVEFVTEYEKRLSET